ncbi:hypothetical protein EVC29_073 [Rhizobium phage RHph_Y52]|nr:hypothetical protein EVB53_071 [Rhizobium phage RHph_Y60]QIG73381.1 hypothetical protein EVC03_073 [Rhizobium phage RHph_Y5A]QIG75302.1 hypothetical protein EVC16_073 [Rhizobium phage RHph_Y21]QIG75515.1 hypothetical protein EVC18_073 [Rhizobium phage RHph_Y2_4]QIG76774.1 hypothetical protein EVC29_073 [Rhizobium phage RHph_Y52]
MLEIIDKIKHLLHREFGIPVKNIDREDNVGADWGLVGHERKALETELYKEFPLCAESFRDCVTIEDFARMVAP